MHEIILWKELNNTIDFFNGCLNYKKYKMLLLNTWKYLNIGYYKIRFFVILDRYHRLTHITFSFVDP